MKLLWGVCSSVVVRTSVLRPSPYLCCVVGGSSGFGCEIPLPMLRVLVCSRSFRFYPLVDVSPLLQWKSNEYYIFRVCLYP